MSSGGRASLASSLILPFLAGAATTCVALHLVCEWKRWNASRNKAEPSAADCDSDTNGATGAPPNDAASAEGDHPVYGSGAPNNNKAKVIIMDSPDLDQRMIRKAEGAIIKRTSRLIVVVERCTNDHNYSAILRTVEALGVQNVWIVAPPVKRTVVDAETPKKKKGAATPTLRRSTGQVVKRAAQSEIESRTLHHLFAQNATEWIDIREFDDTASCVAALREDRRHIWVTDLGQKAVCLTVEGLQQHFSMAARGQDGVGGSNKKLVPDRLAIVFGTEAVGCTAEMLHAADLRVYLPLRGFADSLNLSVATALCVHQLFVLDPTLVGATSEEERKSLRRRWYAKLASQRLLTGAQKKKRSKLVSLVRSCEEIEWRARSGEFIDPEQREKLSKLGSARDQLHEMDDALREASVRAVKDLVNNPPAPLSDMRRADEHRTCYVGKGTKSMYKEVWADMPATAYYDVAEKSHSATFFRERARQTNGN